MCQLITGARYDLGEGKIIVDIKFRTPKDRRLVIWKLNDLYDELEMVMHVLSRHEMPYVDIIGDLVHYPTNRREVAHAREMKVLGEKLKAEINARVTKLYKGLHSYWVNDEIELKKKFVLSRKLFRKFFLEYGYFEFFETDRKYDRFKRVYALQEHIVRYLRNGMSKVEMIFRIVNISYSTIEKSYVTIQGVIPVYNNEDLNLRVYDRSGKELHFSFIKDTFNEKVLEIDTPPLSPGKLYAFRVTFDWPYPIEIGGRRRWYSVPLFCFDMYFENKEFEDVKDVFRHYAKLEIFAGAILPHVEEIYKAIKAYKKEKPALVEDLGKAIKEPDKRRKAGFYVDYKNGKWYSPFDIRRAEAKAWILFAKKRLPEIRAICQTLIESAPLAHMLYPKVRERVRAQAKLILKKALDEGRISQKEHDHLLSVWGD